MLWMTIVRSGYRTKEQVRLVILAMNAYWAQMTARRLESPLGSGWTRLTTFFILVFAIFSRWRQKKLAMELGARDAQLDLLHMLRVGVISILTLQYLRPEDVVLLGCSQSQILNIVRVDGRWVCPSVEVRFTNSARILARVHQPSLRTLHIWTRRGFEQCRAMHGTKLFPSVEEIALRGCSLRKADFCDTIWPELRVINCEKNACTDETLQSLLRNVPTTSLHTLNLRYNRISLELPPDAHTNKKLPLDLASAVRGVRTLNLKMNRVAACGISALAPLLRCNLRVLNLGAQNPRMTHEAASILSHYLVGSPLQCLRLRGNAIGDKGAVAFCAVLSLCDLRELDVEENELTIMGKMALRNSAKISMQLLA